MVRPWFDPHVRRNFLPMNEVGKPHKYLGAEAYAVMIDTPKDITLNKLQKSDGRT